MGYQVDSVIPAVACHDGGGGFHGVLGGIFGGLLARTLFPGYGGYGYGYGGGYGAGCGGGLAGYEGRESIRNAIDTNAILGGEAAILKQQFDGALMQSNASCAQTLGLTKDICAEGRHFDTMLANMASENAECCCETQKDVIRLGKDNEIFTLKSMNGLQKEIDHHALFAERQLNAVAAEAAKCCCDTNLNIERSANQTNLAVLNTAHETQIRDLCAKNDTDKQLAEIKCQIREQAKDTKIEILQNQLAMMSQCNQTQEIKNCINASANKTGCRINQLGVNQHLTDPTTTLWPPDCAGFGCCC